MKNNFFDMPENMDVKIRILPSVSSSGKSLYAYDAKIHVEKYMFNVKSYRSKANRKSKIKMIYESEI